MEREVHYCTTEDGVRIAYRIEGEGPALLWCPIFVESFSLHHLYPPYVELLRILGLGRQLICYDMRGVGLSQRDVVDFSNRALVRDIEAVVAAARLGRFSLWGNSMSGPRAVTYAAENPERLMRLVLFGTTVDPTSVMPLESARPLAEFAKANWKSGAHSYAGLGFAGAGNVPGREADAFDEIQRMGRMYEESTEGVVASSMVLEAYNSWDVRGILALVKTPTLVIHGLNDAVFPFEGARQMTEEITEASLIPLQHTGGLATDLIFYREQEALSMIETFLGGPVEPATGGGQREVPLTPRELEVLLLLVAGQSNRLIAETLVLSQRTVARHIANIYLKTGVHGRAEVTAYALRHRLV